MLAKMAWTLIANVKRQIETLKRLNPTNYIIGNFRLMLSPLWAECHSLATRPFVQLQGFQENDYDATLFAAESIYIYEPSGAPNVFPILSPLSHTSSWTVVAS